MKSDISCSVFIPYTSKQRNWQLISDIDLGVCFWSKCWSSPCRSIMKKSSISSFGWLEWLKSDQIAGCFLLVVWHWEALRWKVISADDVRHFHFLVIFQKLICFCTWFFFFYNSCTFFLILQTSFKSLLCINMQE